MAKWGSLICITMLVLLLNFATLALSNQPSSSFRAFYFIQQWLPSYCKQKGTTCCYPATGKPPASFSIYGLWPYNDQGSSLQNCPGASFDVAPLKPMESMLHRNWPSFTCPQIGRKFWLHEWNKHGTCSKSVFNEMSYLHTTLNLNKKINVLQALAKAGIKPDNRVYPLPKVVAAIGQAAGVPPTILCNRDAQGNAQIWQVVHCVDKSGVKVINCPSPPKGHGCTSSIKFPSY